jgi:hypothetical protein
MEPSAIGCNFRELGSGWVPIQNDENNPMHSRTGLDDKEEFWVLSPRLPLSSPGLDRAIQYSETAVMNR